MKYSELLKLLKKQGWYLSRHGGAHDIYKNDSTGERIQIPRHAKEIPTGTLLSILKTIGIK